MQQLTYATNSSVPPAAAAQDLLAAVPHIMRFIVNEMRRNRHTELTVPQFRTLVFLSHNEDMSLSAVAEHLGLSLPAASRMANLLVKRGLLDRRAKSDDRRYVSLSVTPEGRAAFQAAHTATQVALAERFKALPAEDLAVISEAMRALSGAFSPENNQGDRKNGA